MSDTRPSLFGRPIFSSSAGLTLTAQVREILLEEILSGHWTAGERLPSVAALARQSGLSRWPIQEAFEALRKEGYLRQEERSGTYLECMSPEGRKPVGTVGVAMLLSEGRDSWSTAPYAEYRLSRVLSVAERRHYAVEVKYLRGNDDWSELDRVGAVFQPRIAGVISLYPFRHPFRDTLEPDRLPFVHLGGNSHICLPTVAGDTIDGFYRLTQRVLDEGHREIVCLPDPFDSEWEARCAYMGHERAMRQAGLPVNQAAWDYGRGIETEDLAVLRTFLDEFRSATAVICMWGCVSSRLVEVAEMAGIAVPKDLSIVAHGASAMGARNDVAMTHLDYDMDGLVDACFDLILEQKAERHVCKTLVLGSAWVREGASLGAPRKKKLERFGRVPGKGKGSRIR